jgi:hypothetical protein
LKAGELPLESNGFYVRQIIGDHFQAAILRLRAFR